MDWSGFHRRPWQERVRLVARHAGLDETQTAALGAALAPDAAERFIENAIGSFALPLGVAVHFVVDGTPVLVPMAVEESSVVAAASHGAKLAAAGGGFRTQVGPNVVIGQIELRGVADVHQAAARLRNDEATWRTRLDALVPRMVARGGGVRGLEARIVGERLIVHLHLDTQDAMGANAVNTLCEAAAPLLAEATGGRPGLRILSNLATQRLVTTSCRVPAAAVGGPDVVAGIVAADQWAHEDPYRAATHNKGIMNGIDPVLIATGNDWRAVEAGAHAYAVREGHYQSLTTWRQAGADLEGTLTLPLAVGTVGGVTRVHPTVQVCMKVLGSPDAARLAAVIASVGLAQNLAALRALSQEGIQRGHMALHARNLAMAAGLQGSDADAVAARMVADGDVSAARARALAAARHPKQ